MEKQVGIIGCGNMGQAIAERIKADYQVVVFDKDTTKTENLKGIEALNSIADLVKKVDAIILAVKPQDFEVVLEEIKGLTKDRLIISIAAGISSGYIEKKLVSARAIRVMPNLAARIGRGMICLCKGRSATEEDLNFSKRLFNNLGKTMVLPEDMMDAATAISGSGPGFLFAWAQDKSIEEIKKYAIYTFGPALAKCARNAGFNPEQADILAEATAAGSVAFLEATKINPGEAKKQVASKAGTTEAGLKVLQAGGTLEEAVNAALNRAKELSRS